MSNEEKELQNLRDKILRGMATKMGYPESMLSSLHGNPKHHQFKYNENSPSKLIDNRPLGIMGDTLAELLIINVGNPWTESKSFTLEAKDIERKVIRMLGHFFGLSKQQARGYVTSGGTEANFAGLWWCQLWLREKSKKKSASLAQKLEIFKKRFENNTKIDASLFEAYLTLNRQIEEADRPVVYFSDQTHYSISKICEMMHLNSVSIRTDLMGQMDMEDFKNKINDHAKNRSHRGIIVVANLGTTVTGAFDDLKKIHTLLEKATSNGKKIPYSIHADGAMYGITLPLTHRFGKIENYFKELGINTLTLSGHKLLGTAVCGICLTTKRFLNQSFSSKRTINYCGDIEDITFSGCRSGTAILWLYHTLTSLDFNKDGGKLKGVLQENFKNARYLYGKLDKLLGRSNVLWVPHQFNILFKKPSDVLIKKYCLMPAPNDQVVACVLMNVNRRLIDQFIEEYTQELQKDLL